MFKFEFTNTKDMVAYVTRHDVSIDLKAKDNSTMRLETTREDAEYFYKILGEVLRRVPK